jgi:hypothetical protein
VIAYLSHDQVNSALVRRMARRLGVKLIVLMLKDVEYAITADLLVLDLDHLPPKCRSELFERIGSGEFRSDVAVHSYHITAAEARSLAAAGVRVARRLTAAVLAQPLTASSTE